MKKRHAGPSIWYGAGLIRHPGSKKIKYLDSGSLAGMTVEMHSPVNPSTVLRAVSGSNGPGITTIGRH